VSERVVRRDDPSLDPQHDAPRIRREPTDVIARARRYTDDVIDGRDPIALTDDDRAAMRAYVRDRLPGDAQSWSDARLASSAAHLAHMDSLRYGTKGNLR
jgi:mono/diheme cytochrome c family protein